MYRTIAESWFDDGEKKGRAVGQARALLRVLEHRSVIVPEPVRERVLATLDEPQLERWLARALTVTSAEEIFDSNNP